MEDPKLMAILSIVCYVGSLMYLSQWVSILIASTVFLALGGWIYPVTIYRDILGLTLLMFINARIAKVKRAGKNVVEIFEDTAERMKSKPMFQFEGRTVSFSQANEDAEKVATFLQKQGLQHGDCVALLLENSPDLVIYWLGAAKIGVVSALINFNLRQQCLAHTIKICNPKTIICSDTLIQALEDIENEIPEGCQVFIHTEAFAVLSEPPTSGITNSRCVVTDIKSSTPGYVRPKLSLEDTLLYIYTSGTTGFPKAARISNFRYSYMVVSMEVYNKFTDKDIIWSPLPLYHSNAGILGVGMSIVTGCTLAFRPKFSASRFWADIVKSEATAFQYLGEICRYVYKQPVTPIETQHKLRLMMGNGLSVGLWTPFITRYNIPKVAEIYGSTEGNCNMVNVDNTPGAVGFMSIVFSSRLHNVQLLLCDDEGNLIRDKNGFAIKAKPGEQGHMVGEIIPHDPLKNFDGYVGTKETQKKIAHDVIQKGDTAFLSGDILYKDRFGYLYFKDRTGDTFRWKGENVATCEVESVIRPVVGHRDVIVYGVTIPGNDGRAGMASILNDDNAVDLNLVSRAVMSLPSYARPIFVRLLQSTSEHMTGTYKLRKLDLQKEGFDVAAITDEIYFWVANQKSYELLTAERYAEIIKGKLNL